MPRYTHVWSRAKFQKNYGNYGCRLDRRGVPNRRALTTLRVLRGALEKSDTFCRALHFIPCTNVPRWDSIYGSYCDKSNDRCRQPQEPDACRRCLQLRCRGFVFYLSADLLLKIGITADFK
jgi:hypothetical protein